eukprot:gene2142-3071_t
MPTPLLRQVSLAPPAPTLAVVPLKCHMSPTTLGLGTFPHLPSGTPTVCFFCLLPLWHSPHSPPAGEARSPEAHHDEPAPEPDPGPSRGQPGVQGTLDQWNMEGNSAAHPSHNAAYPFPSSQRAHAGSTGTPLAASATADRSGNLSPSRRLHPTISIDLPLGSARGRPPPAFSEVSLSPDPAVPPPAEQHQPEPQPSSVSDNASDRDGLGPGSPMQARERQRVVLRQLFAEISDRSSEADAPPSLPPPTPNQAHPLPVSQPAPASASAGATSQAPPLAAAAAVHANVSSWPVQPESSAGVLLTRPAFHEVEPMGGAAPGAEQSTFASRLQAELKKVESSLEQAKARYTEHMEDVESLVISRDPGSFYLTKEEKGLLSEKVDSTPTCLPCSLPDQSLGRRSVEFPVSSSTDPCGTCPPTFYWNATMAPLHCTCISHMVPFDPIHNHPQGDVFICCVCLSLAERAVVTRCCQNIMCSDCAEAITIKQTGTPCCPYCRHMPL